MITAILVTLAFTASGLFVIIYFEKKRQKEIDADIKRHDVELKNYLLDDFEKKISD